MTWAKQKYQRLTTEQVRQSALVALGTRLKAAEAALDVVDLARPLHLRAARDDVRVASQMLAIYKQALGPDTHQQLLDQLRALEARLDN